jgi:hypothetical protein
LLLEVVDLGISGVVRKKGVPATGQTMAKRRCG